MFLYLILYKKLCNIFLYFTVGLDRLYKIRKKYRYVPNVISHILLSPVVWKVKMAEDDIAFLLNRGELVELVYQKFHKISIFAKKLKIFKKFQNYQNISKFPKFFKFSKKFQNFNLFSLPRPLLTLMCFLMNV